jgi:tRNA nucleotidyltransferase/poly(A) polymerase
VIAPEAARALRDPIASIDCDAWIVGGCLRDALAGRPVADVDVAVAGDPAAAAKAISRAHGASRFQLSRDFGAWRLTGGTLPWQVDVMPVLGGTLEEDLSRRDFTVNALAMPVAGQAVIIDRSGGLADLEAGRIALVSPSALRDDPVRVLRLARIAHQMGFAVDPAARDAARAAAPAIRDAPGERVMDEFSRIIGADDPVAVLDLFDSVGGLAALVPELDDCRGVDQSEYHHLDVLGHTMEVLGNVVAIERDPAEIFRGNADVVAASLSEPLADGLTRGQALRITALLHDMAKAATRAVTAEGRVTFIGHDQMGADMADGLMRHLRTSNRLRDFVVHGVRQHLVLGFMVHRQPLSLVQQDRYLRRVAPDPVEAIVLSVADRLATDGPRTTPIQITKHLALARELLTAHIAIEAREPIRPAIDGAELAEVLARSPGPWVAELLIAIREEQLMGRLADRVATERFARHWNDAHPPTP